MLIIVVTTIPYADRNSVYVFVYKANLSCKRSCDTMNQPAGHLWHMDPGSALASAGPDWQHLCGTSLSGVCRTFLEENHVITIDIRWCESEDGGMTNFPLFNINFTDNAVTPNKCMSCYVQYLQRWDIWCSATAHTELKFCSNSNRSYTRCRVYQPWAIYRFTIWQYSFAGEIKQTCPITLVLGENFCCDGRWFVSLG